MLFVISSSLKGSKYIPASPTTSGSDVALATATGVPHSSITEVLFYTVEPRIPRNDVFPKCWIIESNPVGA